MKFDRKYVSYTARSNHDLTRPEDFRRFPVTPDPGRPQALAGSRRADTVSAGRGIGRGRRSSVVRRRHGSRGESPAAGLGRATTVEGKAWKKAFGTGGERTFEQDPKYALRLLVDIAIRALSPAINDPTTAVQALDQIEDLLLRLGSSNLDAGQFLDQDGKLRLVVPFPTWDDFLLLA